MHKIKIALVSAGLILLVLLIGVLFFGCGSSGSGSSDTPTYLFYNNTKESTPVFEPTGGASEVGIAAASWESGNPLYSVYYTLREFLASRDEGLVDRSNLYKLLIDVDNVYSRVTGSTQSITEQSITPPFSQLSAVTCNQAVNDTANSRAVALKETTAEVNAIVTWIWTEEGNDDKAEYGIATIQYDKLTKDVTVEMTFSVDYDIATPTTDYNLRCYVTGNPDNHTFQFKYIIGTQKIVAKGVSEGAGNYMLFKYSSGEATNYIVVPADSDESFFVTQNSTPSAIYTSADDLPATVSDYKAWVVAENFFSSSNLMTDISILNSGNTKEGTIYLNYE